MLDPCAVDHVRHEAIAAIDRCDVLEASALWQNSPARALLRRLGFRAYSSDRNVIELRLELEHMSEATQRRSR